MYLIFSFIINNENITEYMNVIFSDIFETFENMYNVGGENFMIIKNHFLILLI